MFLITYEKRNGELIYRKRMSIPGKIGTTTSMGWKIKDIKQELDGKWLSTRDYAFAFKKKVVFNHYKMQIRHFFKKYASTLALIILIPLYIIK